MASRSNTPKRALKKKIAPSTTSCDVTKLSSGTSCEKKTHARHKDGLIEPGTKGKHAQKRAHK